MKKGCIPVEALAMLLFGAAAVAALTGGWRGDLLGITVSARDGGRLALLAVAVVAFRLAIVHPRPRRAAELSQLAARVAAGSVLAAALLSWLVHLVPYVGGADSYGYVSASERILSGALIRHEPVSALLPYDDAINAATPLGYVPTARAPLSNVPAYPIGLPALMAVAKFVGGPAAPFAVAPLSGAVLVALCCWFVYQHSRDSALALIAGAAVAMHPVVFTYAIQPMSDVPATASYLLAFILLLHDAGGVPRAALAGAAAAAALLIRPALLPGAAALVLVPMLQHPMRWPRVAAFATPACVGAALLLWSQWHLYGHPFANGYGPASELFALRFLGANTRSYGYWLVQVHGAIWIAGLVIALVQIGRPRQRLAIAVPLIVAASPYAVYRTYDHWETLRFVLPLLVAATVAAVAAVFAMGRRAGRQIGTWIGVALMLALIAMWGRWLEREHVFDRSIAESRFARAGELVTRATASDAVVLASLHSGSVRYYTGRDTLDWAKIPPGRFDATIAALERAGRRAFVLIDGEEERSEFEALHGDVLAAQAWLPGGQVRDVRLYEAPR